MGKKKTPGTVYGIRKQTLMALGIPDSLSGSIARKIGKTEKLPVTTLGRAAKAILNKVVRRKK